MNTSARLVIFLGGCLALLSILGFGFDPDTFAWFEITPPNGDVGLWVSLITGKVLIGGMGQIMKEGGVFSSINITEIISMMGEEGKILCDVFSLLKFIPIGGLAMILGALANIEFLSFLGTLGIFCILLNMPTPTDSLILKPGFYLAIFSVVCYLFSLFIRGGEAPKKEKD